MHDIHEMIDSLIVELDDLFKALAGGNSARFCALYADMMSKLGALREGAKEDAEAKARQIENLKEQIKRLTTPAAGDGEIIVGGETIQLGGDN